MIELRDTLIFIPFAILYNIFFHRMTEMIYKNAPQKEQFNKSIALLFTIGLISYIVVFLFLPDRPKYNDPNIKLGILIGGTLLIMSAIINNWDNMCETSKLSALGLFIGCMIANTYGWIDKDRFNLY